MNKICSIIKEILPKHRDRYRFLVIYFILFLVFLLHFTSNLIWLHLDAFPFGADELGHLENGMTISRILRDPLDFFRVETIFPHKWGPLQYLISSLLILCFGYTHQTLMATNTLLFSILIVLVYFIGKKIKDEKTGLLAAFIISMYPIVFHFSRKYTLEIIITTAIALSFLSLLGVRNFENRKKSLFFGITVGLGMLASPKYLLFIAGPLGYTIVKSFIWEGIRLAIFKTRMPDYANRKLICKRRVLNFLLSLGIGFLICLPWYYANMDFFLSIKPYLFVCDDYLIRGESDPNYYFPPTFLSFENLSFYAKSFTIAQAFPFFAIIFVLGLFFVLRERPNDNLMRLLLWIGISYLICTLIKNKTARYTIEYLPAIAVISSLGIMRITSRWLRNFLLCTIIIIGLSQYFYYSYCEYQVPEKNKQNLISESITRVYGNFLLKMYEPQEDGTNWSWDTADHLPDASNFSRKNFARKIEGLIKENDKKAVYIFFISDPWSEYIRVLEYFAKVGNSDRFLDLKLKTRLFHPIHPNDMLEDFVKDIEKYDLIIFLSNEKGYNWPSAKRLEKDLVEVRKIRLPKPEDPKELKLDMLILKKMDETEKKFELVDKIKVERCQNLIYEDLFVNIYKRTDQ